MQTQEMVLLLLIRGAIAGMPEDLQAQIAECAEKLRVVVAEYGPAGNAALGLVGAEMSAKS